MEYRAIDHSANASLRNLGARELAAYFEAFLNARGERLEALASAVRGTPGFEKWDDDRTPQSLLSLGDWFSAQVKTRDRTNEERDAIVREAALPIDPPREELTERTFAIATDVGVYFAEVLSHDYPSLRWAQVTKNKRLADYGHAVLTGFRAAPLNPVRITITLAYAIASGSQDGRRLSELFDYWSKQVALPTAV